MTKIFTYSSVLRICNISCHLSQYNPKMSLLPLCLPEHRTVPLHQRHHISWWKIGRKLVHWYGLKAANMLAGLAIQLGWRQEIRHLKIQKSKFSVMFLSLKCLLEYLLKNTFPWTSSFYISCKQRKLWSIFQIRFTRMFVKKKILGIQGKDFPPQKRAVKLFNITKSGLLRWH